jgi:hypothetical protein
MQHQRLQVDFILQKQHLQPHAKIHQTMYMPSHTEFVIEVMSRLGFKPGLSLGLDDFAQASFLLNQSDSEVLIVCGADQHFREAFHQGWQRVRKPYLKKVLLVSEPIYSPLAFQIDAQHSAADSHEQFLAYFQPDVVLYLSQYDVATAQSRHPHIVALPYSLADEDLFHEAVIPWEHKAQALLWLGKHVAWEFSRRQFLEKQTQMTREEQLQFFAEQHKIPFRAFIEDFTFRECYLVANQYRFQLQPLSGFAFHSARAVQAAIVNSIPVLLLRPDDLEILSIEAPFVRPGQNCLVALEGEYDLLLDQIADTSAMADIAARGGELLQAGTIQSCLRRLGHGLLNGF